MTDPARAARTAPRARAPLVARVALLVLTLLLAAAALEVGARVRMAWKYGRSDTSLYDTVLDPVTGLHLPQPSQTAGFATVNALGFRGPGVPVPKPPGTVRLAFLGASTTFCAEASSDAATWPARVGALLAERFPRARFDVVNAGVPAIGVEESRRNLRRVAPLEPDVIVVYHATNDLSRDTRALARERGLFTGGGDERSALARASVAWDLIEKNARLLLRRRTAERAPERLVYDADALAAAFEERLAALLREAGEVAPRVAVATFVTQFRPDQDEATQHRAATTSFYYMPYMSMTGLLEGFAAYNRAIRRAAAATDALLVADEERIPGDGAHFHDAVHFTDLGCERMAERVVDALAADARFRALLGAAAE